MNIGEIVVNEIQDIGTLIMYSAPGLIRLSIPVMGAIFVIGIVIRAFKKAIR